MASSPFVKTHLLFVKPENSDLPAGRTVKLLVGFQNNGTSPFLVETIEGSFRYPQDFSYYIQNVFKFSPLLHFKQYVCLLIILFVDFSFRCLNLTKSSMLTKRPHSSTFSRQAKHSPRDNSV